MKLEEPRAGLRCIEDVRSFTDELLGEVIEFMDETVCTDSIVCDGSREGIEAAIERLSQKLCRLWYARHFAG